MTSAPGQVKTWTHQVRLNRALPATRDEYQTCDGRVVFTSMDREGTLRAIVDTPLAKQGEAVAFWDPSVRTQRGRGAFVYRDGSVADVVAKQTQFATPVKPHTTISWSTDLADGKVVCLPYRVKWNNGGPVKVERIPFNEAVTTLRAK